MGYQEIFTQYSKISREYRSETFLDLIRQSHKELVWSRLLAYFLDQQRGQEMSSLWLSSLFSALNISLEGERVEDVKVEEATYNGKSIDIFLITSKYVIAIENKIYAGLYNDFDEYKRHTESFAKNTGRSSVLVLLTLLPLSDAPPKGFQSISWKILSYEVRSRYGLSMLASVTQQSIYFHEFMATISGILQERRMNSEFVDFVVRNRKDLDRLFSDLQVLRNDLYAKSAQFEQDISQFVSSSQFTSKQYRVKSDPFFSTTFFDILTKSGIKLAVDVVFEPTGVKTQIFTRERSKIIQIIPLLQTAGIGSSADEDSRQLWNVHFSRDEDTAQIAAQVAGLLGKIEVIAQGI